MTVPPAVAQPPEFVSIAVFNLVLAAKLPHKLIKIIAVIMEIRGGAIGGFVVLVRQIVCKRLEPPEEAGVVTILDGGPDVRVAPRCGRAGEVLRRSPV